MTHAEEIQAGPGQIQFSMTLAEAGPVPVCPTMETAEEPSLARPGELVLTGPQVLAGLVSAMSLVGFTLWAVMKLWLLQP